MDICADRIREFITKAKAATYVGTGPETIPLRPGAKELQFSEAEFVYTDSYFGNRDFLGQEIVHKHNTPVWGMNYYGFILRPDLITAGEAGKMIKTSLSLMYEEGRFLGGYKYRVHGLLYVDSNQGDVARFSGTETIWRGKVPVYRLNYHGGMVV